MQSSYIWAPLRAHSSQGCTLTFVLRSRRRGRLRGGLTASPGRLGAGGPRARPPVPLLRAPGSRLRREGTEDRVVLGKSQDSLYAVQPRGASSRAAEQVAGKREAAVGHGGGAAGQVHGERQEAGGRGPRSRSAACFGDREKRLEVGSSRVPPSHPRGPDPRSSLAGDVGPGCVRRRWARPAAAWVSAGV